MGVQAHEGGTRTFIAGAALAQHRRVKLTAGKLAYASDTDTDCLGHITRDTFADGDAVAVRKASDGFSHIAVAAASFAAGAGLYAAADGKVDDSGTVPIGVALTASGANGDWVEYEPLADGAPIAVARGAITQDDAQVYELPITNWRVTATGALLGASAGTPAGAFGLTAGTHATAPPVLVGEAASGNVKTNKCRQTFVLPPEYVAGETVTLRVRAIEAVGAATVSTSIDAVVVSNDGDGTVSADLCATSAIDVTATVGNKDFTITPTSLEPGMELDIELTGVTTDTGGTVGTVLTLYRTQLLLDVQG